MSNTKNKDFGEKYEAPEPMPLFKPLTEPPEYPIHALGDLAEIAKAMEDITQAPIELAAQSILAIISLCTQSIGNVQTLRGYKPLSLNCLSIAPSGARKSASDSLILDAVYEVQEKIRTDNQSLFKEYEIKMQSFKASKDRLLKEFNSRQKDKEHMSREAYEHRLENLGDPPKPPTNHIIIATDPTYEGLFLQLSSGRPSMGLMTDEGGMLIGGSGMQSENRMKTVSALSKIWDGTPLNRTRASAPAETITGRRVAVHILLQPIIANILLGDPIAREQGILARFLTVAPKDNIGHRTKEEHSQKSEKIIKECGKKIYQHLLRPFEFKNDMSNVLALREISIDLETKYLLQSFSYDTETKQVENGEYYTIRPYASKAAEQAARIAGCMTLFRDPDTNFVEYEDMKNAITLMKYYLKSALYINDTMAIPNELLKAETLRLWLVEEYKEDFVTARVVMNKAKGNFRKSKAYALKHIQILEEHGWLSKCLEQKKVDGRTSKDVWRINRG